MPKKASYRVSWSAERAAYLLTTEEHGEQHPPTEDVEGWLRWLEGHDALPVQVSR